MRRRSVPSLLLAATRVLPVLLGSEAALAQPLNLLPSNIGPSDTRSLIAPALPVPPVPSSDPPSLFLSAARRAVLAGRTGEAQEALERAETRLLDRDLGSANTLRPDNQQAVLAIGAARRALAARDRQGAIVAIDDALASADRPRFVSEPAPKTTVVPAPAVLPPSPVLEPEPVITRALLPGHWTLHGARYVWIPPETRLRRVQTAGLVPGAYVWRDGAYVWVPAHYAN